MNHRLVLLLKKLKCIKNGNPPVTYIYQLNTLAARFSKGPVSFWFQKNFEIKTCWIYSSTVQSELTNRSILLCYLILSLYHLQSYWYFDLKCKHSNHKIAFIKARNILGTFEKRATDPQRPWVKFVHNNMSKVS